MAIAPQTPSSVVDVDMPRPRDVGILAMEVYFPYRVSPTSPQSTIA